DGKFLIHLVLYGSGTERSEIYAQNVKEKAAAFAVVNDQNALFYPEMGGEQLFIMTNWKAPQWRVFAVDLGKPGRDQWKEVIPETRVHLERLRVSAGKLVAVYTRNASSEVKVFDADGKNVRAMELPRLGIVVGGGGRWG